MKKKILIFGSGSIGTHHTNAAISLNCEVYITDKKSSQLINMRDNIYPSRYGKWNNKIKCIPYKLVFKLKHKFDIIIIGVPPSSHLKLIRLCQKNFKFKKILVEKPLCVYNENFNFLKKKEFKDKIFCGFNHSISRSFLHFLKILKKNLYKNNSKVQINIDWKESFKLVLKAHPWIKSIRESYLSNYKVGGGVSHEYSHAIHLLIILKEILFRKNTPNFKKDISFKKVGKTKYDKSLIITYLDQRVKLNLFLNSVNNPPQKRITVKIGNDKSLKWERQLEKQQEIFSIKNGIKKNVKFFINRRKDFIDEIKLLLKKDNNKDLNFLKLNYAMKVNLFLKNLFTSHVQKI